MFDKLLFKSVPYNVNVIASIKKPSVGHVFNKYHVLSSCTSICVAKDH